MLTSSSTLILRNLLFLGLIFSSFQSFSQVEKHFFNKDWIYCSESDAKYYRVIEEVDTLLKVTDYYMSGGKQSEGFIENKPEHLKILKIRGDFEQKTIGLSSYYRKNGKIESTVNRQPFHASAGVDQVALNHLDSLDSVEIDVSQLEFQTIYYKNTVETGFVFSGDQEPHGNWIETDLSSGVELSRTHYKNGTQEGISAEFYKSGVLKQIAYFKNGDYHGEHRKYNRKGVLKKGKVYENGTLKETWLYQKPKK